MRKLLSSGRLLPKIFILTAVCLAAGSAYAAESTRSGNESEVHDSASKLSFSEQPDYLAQMFLFSGGYSQISDEPLLFSNTKTSAIHKRSGWMSIEAGGKPAYLGIHGGTAPISLLHAADGELFAFTGKTGNDFVYILRGGSVNASGNAEQANEIVSEFAQRDSTASPQLDASALKVPTKMADADTAQNNTSLSDAQTNNSTVNLQPANASGASDQVQEQETNLEVMRGKAAPESAQPVILHSTLDSTDADENEIVGKGATSSTAKLSANGQSKNLNLAPSSMENISMNGPSLTFASSDVASNMLVSAEKLTPFGLTTPYYEESTFDSPLLIIAKTAVTGKSTVAFKPLKLLSYKRILADNRTSSY